MATVRDRATLELPASGRRTDLVRDLILPTLLFTALGGMTWAVRGCSGFGAWKGCVFAGVTWGAAWWYLAYDPRREQSRRYASPWIVAALTFGIGMAGIQGWMQWPSLFEGKLMLDSTPGAERFEPISRSYGFLWLFVAGANWAGLGACLLAWCGSLRPTRVWHWFVRIAMGLAGAYLARFLVEHYPQHFLPLYDSLQAQYQDPIGNPNLKRMLIDCTDAIQHSGLCLGFLAFEVFRRDWKNVVLILAVSILNGAGWALCQNWTWANHLWPDAKFNFWRCWESSGGLSMGVAFGVAYFLVNRPMSERERAAVESRRAIAGPNFEWLLIFLGLTWLLSIVFRIEVPWHIPLTPRLAELLNRDHLEWSAFFFAIVCALGAAYYFDQRWRPIETATTPDRSVSVWRSIEWFGFLLTVAAIVGLCMPLERYDALGRSLKIYAGIARLSRLMLAGTSFLGPGHAPMIDREAPPQIAVMQLALAVVMLLGIAWFLLGRRRFEDEKLATTPADGDPNLDRFGLALGLLAGLGLSLEYGVKGALNVRQFDERLWDRRLQHLLSPVYLLILLAIGARLLVKPLPRGYRGQIFPHAAALMWLVLAEQNLIAQAITGHRSNWQEAAFAIYYVLLFAITAVTIVHFQSQKSLDASRA